MGSLEAPELFQRNCCAAGHSPRSGLPYILILPQVESETGKSIATISSVDKIKGTVSLQILSRGIALNMGNVLATIPWGHHLLSPSPILSSTDTRPFHCCVAARMETTSESLRHAQRWDILLLELERMWSDNNVYVVCCAPCALQSSAVDENYARVVVVWRRQCVRYYGKCWVTVYV